MKLSQTSVCMMRIQIAHARSLIYARIQITDAAKEEWIVSSKYKFIKNSVNENKTATAAVLYKEDTNCDGSCVKVNSCPVINDKCK